MHTATHTCAIIQMSAINLRCKTARNQKRSKLKMSAVKKGYTNTHSTFLAQSSCHPLPTLHHVSKDNLALICSILVLMQFSGNIHLGRLFILQNNLLYIDADTLIQILEICQLLSPIAPKYGDLNNNSGLIHLSFFDILEIICIGIIIYSPSQLLSSVNRMTTPNRSSTRKKNKQSDHLIQEFKVS